MIPENILIVFDLSPVKITEIKAIKRNVEEFPDDELTWEAKDEGFVIKKLRRLNKPF